MNLCDVVVQYLIGEPTETPYGWKVAVKVNSWGHEYESEIHAKTKEELVDVKPGYKYLA